ncbi:hypothetical protein MKX03_015377 [Papaver bracteatum]|nr:hypothetical protein MKX03_015377 [Papaver bracteatum]
MDEKQDMQQSSNETKLLGSYNSESHFDTNTNMVHASLVCALICALGVNSILRCGLDGQKVKTLPNCNHDFHMSCIDIWLIHFTAAAMEVVAIRGRKNENSSQGTVYEVS